jgi:hypothetical protein
VSRIIFSFQSNEEGRTVTSVIYEFYLSLMKDHFLHRDFVLFILP